MNRGLVTVTADGVVSTAVTDVITSRQRSRSSRTTRWPARSTARPRREPPKDFDPAPDETSAAVGRTNGLAAVARVVDGVDGVERVRSLGSE